MSREVFFSSIIYPHSSTKCTCCHGFSDMVMVFLQASLQQAPECVRQQISALPLRWWLLTPPWDRQEQPKETFLAQLLPSSPGPLPSPLCSSQKCRQVTELGDTLPLSAARRLVGKRRHRWRLCVAVHAHASGCVHAHQFSLRGLESTAKGPGVLEPHFTPALVSPHSPWNTEHLNERPAVDNAYLAKLLGEALKVKQVQQQRV